MTSDSQPVPVTADELVARWAQRDAEYVKTPNIDPDMAAVIRQGRMREASMLPNVAERARLYARAATWTPPVPPAYGTLRDWLD